jgi:hypothetical protein
MKTEILTLIRQILFKYLFNSIDYLNEIMHKFLYEIWVDSLIVIKLRYRKIDLLATSASFFECDLKTETKGYMK